MLLNAADYEDKKLQLEGLKNRLEAMASPKLVQAFTVRNLGKLKIILYFIITLSKSRNKLPYCKVHKCARNVTLIEFVKISSYLSRTIKKLREYIYKNGSFASITKILS